MNELMSWEGVGGAFRGVALSAGVEVKIQMISMVSYTGGGELPGGTPSVGRKGLMIG